MTNQLTSFQVLAFMFEYIGLFICKMTKRMHQPGLRTRTRKNSIFLSNSKKSELRTRTRKHSGLELEFELESILKKLEFIFICTILKIPIFCNHVGLPADRIFNAWSIFEKMVRTKTNPPQKRNKTS